MPTDKADHYRLTLKSTSYFTGHYDTVARGGALHFMRNGQPLTIRPGDGSQTGFPDLRGKIDCMIVVPGVEGYCRTPGTADALPLTVGAYVGVTDHCAATANNTDRRVYFDGRDIACHSDNDCRSSISHQQGVIYTVLDNCANPRAEEAGEPPRHMGLYTLTIVDSRHFALESSDGDTRLYKYCAGYNRPPSPPVRMSTAERSRSQSSAP